ncbi:hypothetical protein RVIR1_13300 [Candidatus Rickettsiella viridis]|uniref:Uncharacterized protein n=1 Tax=Candidatus Rickettsiella viridis TaxID=676208 RepID=A0A2Z5V7U6_9COXI|nr:hypothetical protein [Candidatus Rickettsiella viridis]BBB15777.1 hypothetical protein RVIR1_13300 [Candidatus Rickettsiella viridis]
MDVSEIGLIDLKAYFPLINAEEIAFLFQAVRVTNKLPLGLIESLQHRIDNKKVNILNQIIRQLMNWQKENQRLISTPGVEQNGHSLPAQYQSHRLTAETNAVMQPLPSQAGDHSPSLLPWTSIGLAIGGGALIAGGIGLFIIRRIRAPRQPRIGLEEVAAMGALLAGVRQARAEVLNNTFEKGACQQLANHWAGLCIDNAKDAALVWWKKRQSIDWVTLSGQADHPIHDATVLTVNDGNITIQYASGDNQPLVLQNLPAELNEKFDQLVRTLSSNKARWQFTERQWAWFQHQLCQTFGYMLGSHALLHTHCGDILQKLGLRIDWRMQEESRLVQSWLMAFSHLFVPSIFPTSAISSVGAALLETGLVHHETQSKLTCLFGRYTPQAKGIVHVLTNFLQFGCNLWMLVSSVLPFILRKSPELAMILSWSLRLAYSYYSQADWSGFYYCVGLLVLPQLPIVLEIIGIPATRYLDKLVNALSQLFLMESLVHAIALETDNNRVVQSEQTWKETNVRVAQGKQRVQRWCSAASLFFGVATTTASNDEQNDEQFVDIPLHTL